MKNLIFLLVFLSGTPFLTPAQEQTKTDKSLIGKWSIDLRPSPDAEGYFQLFTVTAIEGNSFTGTFYGSEITDGLINNNWEKTYFAFTTADGSSEYYHSGYIENGKLYGKTYCPNRKFIAPWTGTKE